ncbi:hypothetical protein [Halorarum halobium]|uniref:hypothetical protein n=1 Tax=Halorarum halobium TaxID=3075121 RepID=UPI0028AD5801|nr:hypothetical protein [Halobaculum sp. XH14]
MPDPTVVKADETDERTLGSGALEARGLRKPHRVALTNPTDERREATLSIVRSGDALLDERFDLAAAATVAASLTDLAPYDVEAALPATDATESLTIGTEQFTCNHTRTGIGVQADGSLDSTSISTLMACPGVVTERVDGDGLAPQVVGDEPVPADTGKGIHDVVIENPTDDSWTVRLLVDDPSTTRFDGVYTLEADTRAIVTVTESGDYGVDLRVVESDAVATAALSPGNFDCNDSSTTARLDAEGGLDVTTVSTLMACGTDAGNGSSNESS